MKNIPLYLLMGIMLWGNFYLSTHISAMNELHVSIMDVGQGQAVLISYHGKTILLDTGEYPGVVDSLGALLPFNEKILDMVIITHSHFDHYGAYYLIKKRYLVRNLIVSRLVGANLMYSDVLKASNDIPIYTATMHTEIRIDDLQIRLIQLPPPYSNRNNSSIVTELTYHDTSILITGDLEHDRENELLKALVDIDSFDYYVAGHHGSNTSSGIAFLTKIKPTTTIISVGEDNSFGHPSEETLRNLEAIGSAIFRTDLVGTITITCKNAICTLINKRFF